MKTLVNEKHKKHENNVDTFTVISRNIISQIELRHGHMNRKYIMKFRSCTYSILSIFKFCEIHNLLIFFY